MEKRIFSYFIYFLFLFCRENQADQCKWDELTLLDARPVNEQISYGGLVSPLSCLCAETPSIKKGNINIIYICKILAMLYNYRQQDPKT